MGSFKDLLSLVRTAKKEVERNHEETNRFQAITSEFVEKTRLNPPKDDASEDLIAAISGTVEAMQK